MRRMRFAFLLLPVLLPGTGAMAAPAVVVYPRQENTLTANYRPLDQYPVRLLEMALARADGSYAVRPAAFMMSQGRSLLELRQNQHIDVMWTMTSTRREAELLPVRIPIYKGLIGWRLLLIHRKDAARFNAVTDVGQLKQLLALQGHDWPDREIMEANGFRVHGSSDYAGMFKMLESGRVDYFPRSLVEIWNEADAVADKGLVVDAGIALRYRSASYFFVNKQNVRLAADIRSGLEKMIADGSFDRLFMQYHGPLIRRANLGARRIFDLDNPLLPAETPERKSLWFRE